MRELGRLESVPVREVWTGGETEFTKWLADNSDYISEATGAAMPDELRAEQSMANFRVDLVGQVEDGDFVVVENQFGDSDHDHLGKLVTYAAASKAKTAIWIVEGARAEHIEAINLLNQVPSTSFYMLALEVVKISDSLPAPKLTLIVGPSEESRSVAETRQDAQRDLAERQILRQKFWKQLLEQARKRTPAFSGRQGTTGNTLNGRTGLSGVNFYYNIKEHQGTIGLFISTGDEVTNQAIYEQLATAREQIESVFGRELNWHIPEGKPWREIWTKAARTGYRDEDWATTQEAMISAMERFEQALKPFIGKPQV